MLEESQNSSFSLYRTILMGLCVNIHENYGLLKDSKCGLRSSRSVDSLQLNDIKGETLRLTTLEKLPLSGVIEDENGKLRGAGIAFDIFHEVQKKIGFQYIIKMPEKNYIGNQNEGIIQMLQNNDVDMAVTFIPIMTALQDVIDYSSALSEFEWVLFMARPVASASHSGLLDPFQEEVWICILVSLIIAGPAMYLIAFYRARIQKKKRAADAFMYNYDYKIPTQNAYSFGACCWFVYGALMKQGSTMNPIHDSPRLFFATWWIFITILTSFYTANLTAFLTLSHFTLPIQTTHDIYKHHYNWMADQNGYEESLIYVENSFDHLKKTIPKYGRFTNETLAERLRKIKKGEIYISEKRNAKIIISLDYVNKTMNQEFQKKKCTFVISPKSILTKQMAFAYSKGSKFKDLLDPMLQIFVSAGIITHLLDAQLPLPNVCPLDLPSRETKLLNSDFVATYKLLFLGFATAFVAFLGEAIYRCRSPRPKINSSKDEDNFYKSEYQNNGNIIFVNEQRDKSDSALDNNIYYYDYYKEIFPCGYYNKLKFKPIKYRNFNERETNSENFFHQYIE